MVAYDNKRDEVLLEDADTDELETEGRVLWLVVNYLTIGTLQTDQNFFRKI